VYDSVSSTFKVEDNATFTGDMNGNVLYDSTQDLIIEDDLVVRPNNTDDRQAFIGDYNITLGASTYNYTALVADAAGEGWPLFVMKDYATQSGGNPSITNPTFLAEVRGGSPASPAALPSGRRLISFQAVPGINTSGDLAANGATFRVMAVTTETQSSTNQGNKLALQTTKNGTASPLNTMLLEGDTVTINAAGGAGIGGSGGAGTLSAATTLTIDPGSELVIRKHAREYYSTSQTGSYNPDYNDGEWIDISASADITIDLPSNLSAGRSMKVMVYNSSGVNIILTMNSGFIGTASSYTIGAGNRTAFEIERWNTNYITTLMFDNQ
jgi:hypothetical protein